VSIIAKRILHSLFWVALGTLLVVFGGYDDSPGAQLLGIIAAAFGLLRLRRKEGTGYNVGMRNRNAIAVVVLLVAAGLELFYFKFHTYFQRREVAEEMPTPAAAMPGRPAATPRITAQGTFGKVDFVHQGSGTAEIVEYDGKRSLRLENDFEVTNGPDLYVYLAEGTAPTGDPASLGGYADLGALKGNAGSQNYEIPAGTPETYRTAVIWCRQFSVLFSYAVMR
jgi:hypothetical protein